MIHNWYFKDKNPTFKFKELIFQFQLFTDTNRYDLDASKTKVLEKDDLFELSCDGFEWAGGQEKAEGCLNATIKYLNNKYQVDIKAKKDEKIRKIKLRLLDEKQGTIIARRKYNYKLDDYGAIFRYPNGWDDLFTPLVCVKNEKDVRYYRSLDNQVRPKVFMLQKYKDKAIVELIFEQDSRQLENELIVPTWEIGNVSNYKQAFELQRKHIEKQYKCVSFQRRKDVPSWAKKISLVISLHGMHWSGHIFNNYQDMQEKLAWFAKYIDPKDVLVYIPGFDGRYYYKYSNYDPDERMGGSKGLKQLIDFAHKLGYHVMPMFMANGANPNEPGFDIWGMPSRYTSPNGFHHGVGSCDWDTSRSYSLGCGVALNPGAPLWQDKIVNEILKQVELYDFDAIFLDLAAIYENDPHYSTTQGVISIINRLHKKHPELLISTEGWFDALTPYFPLSQCGAQASKLGEMIYHDTPYAKFFDKYNRMFGHLCLGDLANHHNGVFEWGINPAQTTMPLRKGIIQTLTILDDTIDIAKDEILKVIEVANTYKNKYLK